VWLNAEVAPAGNSAFLFSVGFCGPSEIEPGVEHRGGQHQRNFRWSEENKCASSPFDGGDLPFGEYLSKHQYFATILHITGHAGRAIPPRQEPAAVARALRGRGREEHRGGAAIRGRRGAAGIRGAVRRQHRPDWVGSSLCVKRPEHSVCGVEWSEGVRETPARVTVVDIRPKIRRF